MARFTSRKIAVNRVWQAIQVLEPEAPAKWSRQRQSKAKAEPEPQQQPEQQQASVEVRPNSKAATVIDLLRRPGGATLAAIIAATQWQAHTVRGFVSGTLGKKMGLKVRSFQQEGERTYTLEA